MNLDHLHGIALALALGLLVGLERGWSLRKQGEGTRFAGIRTFALFGLAGGIAGTLYAQAKGPATIIVAAAAVLVLLGYHRTTRNGLAMSGTSSMVGLLTLASGFLAANGESVLGAAVAVIMVLLLSQRQRLHRWVGRLSEGDVVAVARFALISLVVLPLLPDRNMGPYDAWNPQTLWLVVVLVSGLSFAGYGATRLLGAERGLLATSAAGAIVSSTAVTAAFALRLRENEAERPLLAAGIALASVVMIARILILVALLAPFALPDLALIALPGMLLSLSALVWLLRQTRHRNTAPDPAAQMDNLLLRNPFDLRPAFLLALLVMAMTLIAHWVLDRYGHAEMALVLAISGSVDADSAIIAMGSLPEGTLDPSLAAVVLSVPVALNSLVKGGLALSIAGWREGKSSVLPLLATGLLVAGAAAAFFILG